MKELNEYRDEIFRRSDEKKRQIQKRRRIALSVGISLCLCCVITLTLIPNLRSGQKGDFAPNMEAVCDEDVYHENGMQALKDAVIEQQFTARVLECSDGWVLVEPLEGEPERLSSDRISFSTLNLEDIGVKVGAKVEITYDGQMMESYPAQIYPLCWLMI
jgi:hypothetical protein